MFLHRLALALGRTVDELLDSISYEELLQWGIYYGVEPWGEWRADLRSAQISAMLANINRDQKKRPEPFKIEEFLLFRNAETEKQQQRSEPDQGAKIDPVLIAWLFRKSGARAEG